MSSIKDFELAQRIHVATHELKARIAALEAEREGLRAFIANLFEATDWPEGGDLDGFQFQELATKHGILTPEERIAPCEGRESCWCSDYGGPGPTTCYRKAQWLIDAQSAIAQGETK